MMSNHEDRAARLAEIRTALTDLDEVVEGVSGVKGRYGWRFSGTVQHVNMYTDLKWALSELEAMADKLQAARLDTQTANDALRTRNRQRDTARAELEAAQARLDRARRADIQLAIHRAVCEDALTHCVENRGRCVRSAEAASWALGLGEEGTTDV